MHFCFDVGTYFNFCRFIKTITKNSDNAVNTKEVCLRGVYAAKLRRMAPIEKERFARCTKRYAQKKPQRTRQIRSYPFCAVYEKGT